MPEGATTRAGEYSIGNPTTERQAAKADQIRQPLTLGAVINDYLDVRRTKVRPRTHSEGTRYLQQYFKPLHAMQIDTVTRRDVAAMLRTFAKDNGAPTADRARSALSDLFAWAIGEGIAEENPVVGTNQASDNTPRSRALSDAELVKIWNGLPGSDYGAIMRLLILTGCRRGEIGGLRWSEVNLDAKTITIPGSRTKNHNEHVVPLSDLALDILKSRHRILGRDLLFGQSDQGYRMWHRAKHDLDKVVPLEPWTVHDIRRTVRTGLGKLGIAPHICEAVLNHLPPRLVRTYDTHKYEAEKRAALDAWASHIKVLLAKASGGNIIELARA